MIRATRPRPATLSTDRDGHDWRGWLLAVIVLAWGVTVVTPSAVTHPEDDLCTPGEDGMDPPSSIVEPFIALSIAWVALDNLARSATESTLCFPRRQSLQ